MVADLLSPDLAGVELAPIKTSRRPRDTMLYALGVGAKPATELENFSSMTGRFSERVEFCDKIITKIWRTAPGEAVVQAETQDGKLVLSQAAVSYKGLNDEVR